MTTAFIEPTDNASPPHAVGRHAADARMLAQQQVRLLTGMARLLRRLLRSLLWPLLSPQERRRVLALSASLESDLKLAHTVARGRTVPPGAFPEGATPTRHGRRHVPPVAGSGQEALP